MHSERYRLILAYCPLLWRRGVLTDNGNGLGGRTVNPQRQVAGSFNRSLVRKLAVTLVAQTLADKRSLRGKERNMKGRDIPGVANPARTPEILPRPEQPFKGHIGRTVKDSRPDFPKGIEAPKGAPNVLLILTDDVGFGASSTFGGPIQTPNFQRLADSGLRYNRFHTTALCSPTRAALITGRNHHSVASGVITEFATGYPGYNSLVPKSAGSVGAVLKENGYNTSWYGKMHNIPDWMSSQAGPFDLWPTGLGFEYFYGFIGGDSDQWHPALYENTRPIEPYLGKPDYILDADSGGQGHRLDADATRAGTGQALASVLRNRHGARAASRAPRLDREVQRQVRPRLGQSPRGDARAANPARRRSRGYPIDQAPGADCCLGVVVGRPEVLVCAHDGGVRGLHSHMRTINIGRLLDADRGIRANG